jgi:hypothetical protein
VVPLCVKYDARMPRGLIQPKFRRCFFLRDRSFDGNAVGTLECKHQPLQCPQPITKEMAWQSTSELVSCVPPVEFFVWQGDKARS